MFDNIAVFDLGSSAIKCMKAKTGIRNFQIESFIVEDLDLSKEDVFERLTLGLNEIITKNDFQDYTIITTVPSNKVFFYEMNFPFSNLQQIADVLVYEIIDAIPMDIDSVVYDFQPISINNDGCNVLVAVAPKDVIKQIIDIFAQFNLNVSFIGTENNALWYSYKYFNTIQDESILQINIGFEKTVVNFISNNNLCATRFIPFGVYNLDLYLKQYCNGLSDAHIILPNIHLDLFSYENNLHYQIHKKLNISQHKFRNLFNNLQNELNQFINEIILFCDAVVNANSNKSIQRILISGGAATLTGLSSFISEKMQIPVVMNPITDKTSEIEIQSKFHIAFGNLINYLQSNKLKTIDFCKDEFKHEAIRKSKKNLYIAMFFGSLSVILIIANIILYIVHQLSSSKYYNKILEDRYRRYFLTNVIPDDPIKEANSKLAMLKREVDSIEAFLKVDEKMIDILYLVATNFPYDANFDLNNMVINENIIRIDGSIQSIAKIDEFKNRLQQTQKFESVIFNTNVVQNSVKFSMTIKLKSKKPKQPTSLQEE